MKRLLRIEVAIALLLFAPLVGYAIGYFVSDETARPAPVDAAQVTTGALPAAAAVPSAVRRARVSGPSGRAGV